MTDSPHPRTGWLSWRVPGWAMAIVVGVFVVTVILVILLQPLVVRELRVRQLNALGAKVSFSFRKSNWDRIYHIAGLKGLTVEYAAVDLSSAVHQEDLTRALGLVRSLGVPISLLDLSRTTVTASELRQLRLIPLRGLNLAGSSIQDADLDELTKLTELGYLALDQTSVTDQGLKRLAGVKWLRSLSISQTDVSDGAIADLCRALPQLSVSDD